MRKDALIAELRENGGPAALELADELETGITRPRINSAGRSVTDVKLEVTLDLNVIWPEKLAELLSLIPGVQRVGPV